MTSNGLIKPSAIFFDLDETLIKNKQDVSELLVQVYQELSGELSWHNRDDFFTTLRRHASTLWNTMFDSEQSPEALFTHCFYQAALSTGVNHALANQVAEAMFNRYCQLSSNNIEFQPGAVDTLAELHELGFITGVITNGIEQIQLGKIYQLNIHQKVDHITVSAQARAHKPLKAVFDLALQRAGVMANQAWQVGDHATNDVAGAIRAGMTGVFYNPNHLDIDSEFAQLEPPSLVIESLDDIIGLLNH